jgi:CDP-2,3-bis-(O-geranylgeranyl)-sn-glycerol synthase
MHSRAKPPLPVDPRPGWVFLPVAGALIAHAPVLALDLAPGLARPLDAGAKLRGRRVLGDNKTVRGALVMFAGAAAAALGLTRARWFRERLPASVADAPPLLYAALIGTTVVVAELPTSFVKRQIGIAPGAQRRSALGAALSLYDQGDFVLGGAVVMRAVWRPSPGELAGAWAVVSGAHLVSNVVGYAIGARDAPI